MRSWRERSGQGTPTEGSAPLSSSPIASCITFEGLGGSGPIVPHPGSVTPGNSFQPPFISLLTGLAGKRLSEPWPSGEQQQLPKLTLAAPVPSFHLQGLRASQDSPSPPQLAVRKGPDFRHILFRLSEPPKSLELEYSQGSPNLRRPNSLHILLEGESEEERGAEGPRLRSLVCKLQGGLETGAS